MGNLLLHLGVSSRLLRLLDRMSRHRYGYVLVSGRTYQCHCLSEDRARMDNEDEAKNGRILRKRQLSLTSVCNTLSMTLDSVVYKHATTVACRLSSRGM